MPLLRWIRYTAWTVLAVLAFVVAAILLGWWRVDGPGAPARTVQMAAAPVDVGGPFSLIDHTGRRVTEAEFRGRPMLVFFGFTHCPEVCPTTLLDITEQLKTLGPEAERLQVLFITVDPERDTPKVVGAFVRNFDDRIVGLTGSPAAIAAVEKQYAVYAKKEPAGPNGAYLVGHSQIAYLMDKDGKPITSLPIEKDAAAVVEQLDHWVR